MERIESMKRHGTYSILALLLTISSLPGARPLLGQVEITATAGLFFPVATMVDEMVPSEETTVPLMMEHQPAATFGGRLAFFTSETLGFEGSFLYSLSSVRQDEGGGSTEDAASVWMASGRVLRRFPRDGKLSSLHLMGGAGFVARRGHAYLPWSGTLDPAVVVGAGAQIDFQPGLRVRFDVENYVSRASFEHTYLGFETDSTIQNDLVFMVGLVLLPERRN